ncbi:MAG: AAA family ATPase [Anaerovoracaceae bacterium]|nr:AAA family ATPase [Bacillota bacterium]MDY2670113.1 AAA family ATPase [Anaerovoracaceae bacterium]
MAKLPIGIQSFENIRRDGYVYIDKTSYINKLANSGKVYFLSRPRRFGKSLFVSTLEAYFRGQAELFRGLDIEKTEDKKPEDERWIEYPVIKFSLSGGDYNSPKGLSETLSYYLRSFERQMGIEHDDSLDLPNQFRYCIESAFEMTGRRVVVLVDEYDKPLLETMTVNEKQEDRNRILFKGVFSVLKDMDSYLKFVFFTGVTKFSKVSIFSDLNQLRDISLLPDYSGICGISEAELVENLKVEIQATAEHNGFSYDECMQRLAEMYDGYHFSADSDGMYNPFSILNALADGNFGNYWFETGTPTFLINKLRASSYDAKDMLDGLRISERSLSDYRPENPDPVPLFYQSGYLTIKSWNPRFRTYILDFPNDEVKNSFLEDLLPLEFNIESRSASSILEKFVNALEAGKTDDFMLILQSLFAGIPYAEGNVPFQEREWRNQMYLVFTLIGAYVKTEIHSAVGRCDCIVETSDYVYVMEFKTDSDPAKALVQIEEKQYAIPYVSDSRRIIKVGATFSSEGKGLMNWKAV